jgi:DNA-binding NtrC family response regulator
LRNAIERAVLLSRTPTLGPQDFVLGGPPQPEDGDFEIFLPDDGVTLEQVEERLVRQALAQAGGNQTRAARLLNLTRDQFRYRLNKYGLT